ncbi:hypothetical protein GCWU000341_00918 [Oribacterium sp. oral taxon 078 str. F0262]|nr:hypothetical protein GCWU000341_00918 [Oribacterium sp. oral taxon 078 str. F0262]
MTFFRSPFFRPITFHKSSTAKGELRAHKALLVLYYFHILSILINPE